MKVSVISTVTWVKDGATDKIVQVEKVPTFRDTTFRVLVRERKEDGRLHHVASVHDLPTQEYAAQAAVAFGAQYNAFGYTILTA